MPQGLSDLPEQQRTALSDLPPSAKLVALVLSGRGEMTQQQLAAATLLSTRTARHALRTLEEAGLVASRVSFMDARQQLYSLTTEEVTTDDGRRAAHDHPVPTTE